MAIEHTEEMPRRPVIYRCHVCHLELVEDGAYGTLILAPLPMTDDTARTPSTSATAPDQTKRRR
jgi:hypothetical protein